ncbi:circularly permuted type 2 ATP-grasp protein, partial [Mesorhizobium sp. M2D.F.Ca.ET.145.01.1.1]
MRLIFSGDASEMASQGSMRLAAFDEMLPEVSGLRRPYSAYDRWLKEQDPARLT